MKNTTLDWLFAHHAAIHTPQKWATLLGVTIIDADGWDRDNYKTPLGLTEFIERVSRCTIR